MHTVSQRAQDIKFRRAQSKIGQMASASTLALLATLINAAPQANEVRTIVVDTATNDHTYVWTINGIDLSFTADGSASKIEIAAGITLVVNTDPLVRGQVSAVSDGVDTVTLTAELPGEAFTLTDVDAKLTAALVTAAAEADSIPFGRLLISTGFQTGSALTFQDGEANELGALPRAANFAAQVDTWTTTFVALVTYYVTITLADGTAFTATALADTNTSDTVDAIAAAVNAVMPANTVVAVGAATFVSFTAEVPGASFSLAAGVGDEGASFPAVTLASTKSFLTSLALAASGISLWAGDEENVTVAPHDGGDVVYLPNAGVRVLRSNADIWVDNAEVTRPSKGESVFVETAAGDDLGKLFRAISATRVLLPGAIWQRSARASSGDLISVLRLDL